MAKTTRAGEGNDPVAAALQAALVDLVTLSLQGKQLHWNVTGPLFSPLHLLFDTFVTEQRLWYDTVAERLRALGQPADGRVAALAGGGVEELPPGLIRDRDAIAAYLARIAKVAGGLRTRLAAVGERDPVTQDLLIGIVDGLDKAAWMLQAQGE